MSALDRLTARMDSKTAQLVRIIYWLGVKHGRAIERITASGRQLEPAEAQMIDDLGITQW